MFGVVRRPTILLAEDEEDLRTMVHRILEQSGYDVLPAADGEEAVTIGERHIADIRLLMADVRMPGLSGHEVARKLQARIPDLKVILMTGAHRSTFAAQSGWLVLPKPFHPNALLSAVRRALEAA